MKRRDQGLAAHLLQHLRGCALRASKGQASEPPGVPVRASAHAVRLVTAGALAVRTTELAKLPYMLQGALIRFISKLAQRSAPKKKREGIGRGVRVHMCV